MKPEDVFKALQLWAEEQAAEAELRALAPGQVTLVPIPAIRLSVHGRRVKLTGLQFQGEA